MVIHKTGNGTVDALCSINFSGNIIHTQWYKTVLLPTGKPDLNGIILLADIVYWYRPAEVRNEITGQFQGWRRKFKADLLQRSYDAFSQQFGLTKTQVRDAITRLENIGVIKRVFRHIKNCANVMYIDLNIEI